MMNIDINKNITELVIDGKLRKAKKGQYGYMYFWVTDGSGIRVHRAVMEAYLGRKLKPTEHIHHIDGDRTNNAISNLQVLTLGEHSRIHRNEEHARGKALFGNNNEKRKRKVIGVNANGDKLVFNSLAEGKANGFSHITDCCKGKRETNKGYKWRYADGD